MISKKIEDLKKKIMNKQEDSRQRILDAAEKVFSEVGYDGARVDKIAAVAKINKAMLYYYFQSKENILEAIVNKYIKELEQIVELNMKNISNYQGNAEGAIIDNVMEYFDQKKNILKIITIEGFKSMGEHKFLILDLLNPVFAAVNKVMQDLHKNVSQSIEYFIKLFFQSILPLIVYHVMEDKWAEHYKIDVSELRNIFISIFKEVNTYLYSNQSA